MRLEPDAVDVPTESVRPLDEPEQRVLPFAGHVGAVLVDELPDVGVGLVHGPRHHHG